MKNNVNMVKGVIKLTKPMILIQMPTFIPYDNPIGLNRKISQPGLPVMVLTYLSLFLSLVHTQPTLDIFLSFSSLLRRLRLCLFFLLSLPWLAATAALLRFFGFYAATSIIAIVSFLRSLFDGCSDI
ncbi:hypothetical protein M9H77_28352 [Catharanthus roseus]|uniref:Uncharacterized protein n=1 Tax=Catharanthus roseus TaxID=4058 RepID=A0ACC0AFG9_CATRO|nr:hypothetical protein M9H77_28352 [Catharanthus roseus]